MSQYNLRERVSEHEQRKPLQKKKSLGLVRLMMVGNEDEANGGEFQGKI